MSAAVTQALEVRVTLQRRAVVRPHLLKGQKGHGAQQGAKDTHKVPCRLGPAVNLAAGQARAEKLLLPLHHQCTAVRQAPALAANGQRFRIVLPRHRWLRIEKMHRETDKTEPHALGRQRWPQVKHTLAFPFQLRPFQPENNLCGSRSVNVARQERGQEEDGKASKDPFEIVDPIL